MSNAILNINRPKFMSPILPKPVKTKKGQVLISLLIGITLFAILAHALFTLVSASYVLVNFTRARIAARHLGQEKLELIRNLPFDNIGTIGGVPPGALEQTENINRNGLNYLVKTNIVYIDDPFDDVAPNDLLPTDYKRVRVDVSWEGLAASSKNPVTLITDIAPRGIETTVGGGTLSILVFDANAVVVPQADVSIIATATSPQVNLNLQTGDNGRVILPGAPTCTNCYQIAVSKPGFSADRTYSTTEVANPNKPHLSVLGGFLTEVSFAIDKVSTLNVASAMDRSNNFSPLGDITFQMRGDKTLGTDAFDQPVYKFNNQFTTDANGLLTIGDLEWDNYTISVEATTGWDIAGTNPLLPLPVLPDTSYNLTFALSTDTTDSLLASFTDPALTPIASVSARLFDDLTFEATASSGLSGDPDFGQVFFSNLSSQTYHLQATASGYLDFNGDVDVSGYTREDIIMN